MTTPRLEFNEVRMSFSAGAEHAGRAERIARLAFEYLQEMLDDLPAGARSRGEVGSLDIGTVGVALGATSDEAAARAAAAEIYRALIGALSS